MHARKKTRATCFDFLAKGTFKQSIIRLLEANLGFWSQGVYYKTKLHSGMQLLRQELVHFKTYHPNLANNENALDLLIGRIKHLLNNDEFKLYDPKKLTLQGKFYQVVMSENEGDMAELVMELIAFYEGEHEKVVYKLCSKEPRLIGELSEREFILEYRKFQIRNNLTSVGEPHSGIVNLMDFIAGRLLLDQCLMSDFLNHFTRLYVASPDDWATFYRIIKCYICDYMTKDKIIFDSSFPNLERLLTGLNYITNRNVFHQITVTERDFLTVAVRSIIESVARCDWLLQYLCSMNDLVRLTNQVHVKCVHHRLSSEVHHATNALGERFLIPHIFKLFVDGDYKKLLQLCTTFKMHGIDYRNCMRDLLLARKSELFNAKFGLLQCKKLGGYPYDQLSNDVIKLIANKSVKQPQHAELKSLVDEIYDEVKSSNRSLFLSILTSRT